MMKKNITINLYGSLYQIDEDAYQLLQTYEDSMRAYFAKHEGGAEISDDIEHRIAELLSELKAQGREAIDIDDVQSIIKRIGQPEEMGDTPSDFDQTETNTNTGKTTADLSKGPKKLYRDPRDRMLGGVSSGLSKYIGGDVLLWRILFVLLTIFSSFSFLVIYVILWIVVPEAKTAEDFLRMEGRPVTPDTLAQQVSETAASASQKQPQSYSGINGILRFLVLIFKIVLYLLAGCLLLVFLCGLIAVVVCALVGLYSVLTAGTVFSSFGPDNVRILEFINLLPPHTSTIFWLLLVSLFALCGIPVYATIHYLLSRSRKAQPMSPLQRGGWIIGWIVSLIFTITFAALLGKNLSLASDAYDKSHPDTEWDWNSLEADEEDLDDDDADDNDSLSISTKLAAAKDSLGLVLLDKLQTSSFLHEEQSQVVPAGVYRVTIYALANDRGAYVYVTGDSLKQMSPVSAGSCRSLVDALEQSSTVPSLDQLLPKVIIDSIKISRPQNLHYGITTRTSITGKPSHCQHLLYASHFNLERIAGYQTRRTMKKK